MPRYFLFISYKGTNYHGWQIQKNAASVQQTLNEGISTILQDKTETLGSGRTDAGVHALKQVVQFDHQEHLSSKDFIYKLNSYLPKDIAATNLKQVKPTANARFDAINRSYVYRITQTKNPFLSEEAYYFRNKVDLNAMNGLNEILLNWNDYKSFSKVKTDVNHFLCDILETQWKCENSLITFHVTANRFLRGMVRALVGTMLEVGLDRMTHEEFKHILESLDRKQAGRSVPPQGLYLSNVEYPEGIFLEN
ncbi:MAG: tRNA pseudouridine(38-40) synthase TruA [Cyclobacteriaceae bacterium]